MSFHDVRFPARLSFGSVGGPERLTEVVTLANGFEERNSPWAHSRRRYDAGLGMRSHDDIADIIAFFEARKGRLHAFRWKDWADYKSCLPSAEPGFEDQLLGTGDGSTRRFQLVKTYRSGDQAYVRPIMKPVAGSVVIGVGGRAIHESDWTMDAENGEIELSAVPARGEFVTAGFEFDVPVRFDTDMIQTSIASFQAGEIPEIPLVEVRI